MSNVKKLENKELNKSYKIVVENKEFLAEYDKRVSDIQKNVKLDGFRKGHVPLDVIKNKYSANILAETSENIINKEVENIIKENKFSLAERPKIEIKNLAVDKDLEFEVSLELLPEIPEIKFEKMSLEKQNIKIESKDVEEEKIHILRNKAEWNEIDKEAKSGDKVKINFLGKVDDVAFEGGKAENYDLILGSKSFIDTFEDQLIGKKKGDKIDVKVTFPKNYGKKDLAGKKAVFEVNINAVSEPKMPELTDEYLKTNFNVENLTKFEETIETELKKAYQQATKNRLKKSIFEWLEKNIKIELPKSIVDSEYNRNINDKMDNKQKDEVKEKAEKDVKLSLIISGIAKNNEIKAEREEIIREIYKIANMYPGQQQMFVDYYMKNQQLLNQVASQVIEEKVMDLIIGKATIKDKEFTIDEFTKLN